MDDASGHYTSGFFYGNNYWLGSLALCESIYHEEYDEERKTTNSGLPFAKAHTQIFTGVYNEKPPFIPGFFVIKFFLNETFPTYMVIMLLFTSYVYICYTKTNMSVKFVFIHPSIFTSNIFILLKFKINPKFGSHFVKFIYVYVYNNKYYF